MALTITWKKEGRGHYSAFDGYVHLEKDEYAPESTWVLSTPDTAAYFRTKSHAQGFFAAMASLFERA